MLVYSRIMRLILGIDPGSRFTGWGLVSFDGNQRVYVDSGVISLIDKDMGLRLSVLHRSLNEILKKYPSDIAVIEKIFLGNNVDSAFKLGHARGVCLMTVTQFGLVTYEYSPRQIKQALTGSGSASKEQVQQFVFEELRIKNSLRHDASDALAMAIGHTYQMEIAEKMKRLKGDLTP